MSVRNARTIVGDKRVLLFKQWKGGVCERCGVKRDTITFYQVHPADPWHSKAWWYDVAVRQHVRCVDQEKCRARINKRRERASVRSSMLIIREPPYRGPHKRGICMWCGEPIILTPDAHHGSRSRNYHRGDEFEVTSQNCLREWHMSRTNDPRSAIIFRGDPCCVDCGSTHWDWDADHEIALEDDGEHTMENLKRRCKDCHKKKTAREARARALRRAARVEQSAASKG